MQHNIADLCKIADSLVYKFPWINGITTEKEYDDLINLMDELVVNYKANENLINLIAPVIEQYEDNAEQFSEFNARLEKMSNGVAVLVTLKDQYNLTLSDFKNEIGGKSSVSMIINGSRELTLNHIKALSKRFNVPVALFV